MRRERVDLLAAVVLVVCWSSGFIGAVLGTRAAPVDTVLAWRTSISALALGTWALWHGQRMSRRALLRQGVLGLLVQVLYLGGVFSAAAAGVPAGTSALLAALQPLLVAALAGPLLGERTSRRQHIGLLIAAGGVALVVAGDLGGGHAPAWAYLLPIGALAALAAGTVLERRWRPSESLITSLALQCTVAAGVFCTVAAARGHLTPPPEAGFWVAVVWLVALSTLGGYGSFLFVVRRSGATQASILLYLTAPATALWAWLLLDQAPAPLAIPGVIVCAAGVGLALRRRGRSPAAVSPAAVSPAGLRAAAAAGSDGAAAPRRTVHRSGGADLHHLTGKRGRKAHARQGEQHPQRHAHSHSRAGDGQHLRVEQRGGGSAGRPGTVPRPHDALIGQVGQ